MSDFGDKGKAIAFGILAIITVIAGFFVYTNRSTPAPLEISTPQPSLTPTPEIVEEVIAKQPAADTPTPAPTSTPKPLRVYITGQVNSPDVYLLPSRSIIKDAIQAAGGPTGEADLEAINLAEELKDQQQIHIPAKLPNAPTPPPTQGGVDSTPTPVPTQAPANTDGESPAPANSGVKININTATAAQLELLPGIGPAIARRIIDHRNEYGAFKTLEDIKNVKGIGTVTFEKLKDNISIE